MKRSLAACLLLAVLGIAGAQDAEPGFEKKSPGAWADRTYHWHYNPRNHPDWLSDAEALAWMQEAARKWEVCGVRMKYEGETDRVPLRRDGESVVGWRNDLPRGVRGITAGPARGGVLVERDIAYAGDRDEFRRHPRLLRKVLVHEFGHAIGLTHSTACNDVMTLAASCPRVDAESLPLLPTANDIARCKALYP